MVGSACTQSKIGGNIFIYLYIVYCLSIEFLVLIFFYSNVSLFPLYPVQYKFIANFSCGGITSILMVHFDICTAFCPKCFLMAAGRSGEGGKEASGRGGMSPILTLNLGGGY